jgi:hypothetical protein
VPFWKRVDERGAVAWYEITLEGQSPYRGKPRLNRWRSRTIIHGPMSPQRHTINQQWLAAIALIAIVVAGCSSDDRFLPALLVDPMVSYEADGIRLVSTNDQARGTDLITRKPIRAQARRVYELEDQTNVEEVLAMAIAAAEEGGWDFNDTSPHETASGGWSSSASKAFDWGPARLVMVVGPTAGESGSDFRLRITLNE